jgi:hypothetical protein
MIFTKPIEDISYQDVIDFCGQGQRETIHLDYKKEISQSLVKTIAAMANTWGGVIVIGVDEQDSAPKLPVEGMPYLEHLRERVNNLILSNITPPVFPEIQICSSQDNRFTFVVIRVPQSHLTPHAIRGNTQVYVRTDTSNEPEELATLDRIQWLVDRRKRSEELKLSFLRRADERFNMLCKRNGVTLTYGDTTFSMGPLFPFELLRDPKSLRREILEKIHVAACGATLPTLVHRVEFQAVQDGTYGFFVNERTHYVCYEELNQYGFFYHREDIVQTERDEEGKETHFAYLHSLMSHLDLFLESMAKLYANLGYWGTLELRIALKKLDAVGFRDLPAPQGYYKIDNLVSSPVDSSLEFRKTLQSRELVEERVRLVQDLLLEIGWAVGFSHLNPETVLKLLKEAGRA